MIVALSTISDKHMIVVFDATVFSCTNVDRVVSLDKYATAYRWQLTMLGLLSKPDSAGVPKPFNMVGQGPKCSTGGGLWDS